MNMDRIIEDKRLIKKKYRIYIAAAVLLLTLLAFVVLQDHETTLKVEKEKLTIDRIFEGPFQDYININGQVEPISIVTVEALESGRVNEILPEDGTMVEKGDVILSLVNDNLNMSFLDEASNFLYLTNELSNKIIQLDQQKLKEKQELLILENDLNDKQRKYQKTESLHKIGGVSDEEFLTTKNSYEIAVKNRDLKLEQMMLDSLLRANQRTNLNLQIRLVRQQLDNLRVKAPVDGQLTLGNISLGQTITKGAPIGQISVLSSYKITAQIDEHYIDRIERGLKATLERQGDTFNVILSKVYPDVVNGVFKVDLVFRDSMPQNIRTGQSYYMDLQLGETQQAVQVARGGFFQGTGGQWIYVLDKDGLVASKRDIKIGRQNPRYYEVVEGLVPGEQVIVSGYDTFGNNNRLILR